MYLGWGRTRNLALALLLIPSLSGMLVYVVTSLTVTGLSATICVLGTLLFWERSGSPAIILEQGHQEAYPPTRRKLMEAFGALSLIWVLLRGIWYGTFEY